jgi:hypothetical protein
MARRRRQLKRRERRQKSSVLGKLMVVVVVAGVLLYFAFTQFFFDPFEASQPEFRVLVPHDVDLFVERIRLDSDMGTFPEPRLFERLARTRAWRDLVATDWWAGLDWPGQVAELAGEARAAMAQEPPLDPVTDLLGSEAALVGRLPAPGMGSPQYALLARLSSKGKVLIEGLDFEAGLQEAFPGASMTKVVDADVPELNYRRLDVPEQGTWFFARELDLLVLGRDEVLVRDVLRTVLGNQESSLGLSRLYSGHMPPASGAPADRLSLPFMLDLHALLKRTEGDETLAEQTPDALLNALGKLVDLTIMEELVGRLELDRDLDLSLFADVDDARARDAHAGLLGARTFRVDQRMSDALGLVPADTSLVVTFNCDFDALLNTAADALSDDLVKLINSTIKEVSKYTPEFRVETLRGAGGLLRHLDRALGDEVTIAVRPADHVFAPGTQPLPALAFIFHVRDLARWNELETALVRGRTGLGLGKDDAMQQDEGVGVRKWMYMPAGLPMEEIAWIVLDRETLVLSTDLDFTREIVSVYTSSRPSLAGNKQAQQAVDALGRGTANLAFWGSAPKLLELIAPYGDWIAEESTAYDRVAARLTQRNHLIAAQYAQYKGREDTMPEDVRAQIEARLDQVMSEMEATRRNQTIPAAGKAWREARQWLDLFGSVGAALRLGEHDADLVLHAGTALGG